MTVPTSRTLARGALWASIGLNTSTVLTNLVAARYEAGATLSILVMLLAAWLWLIPKVDAWVDARLAEALAHKTVAEIALAEVQRLQRQGDLRVGLSVEDQTERLH